MWRRLLTFIVVLGSFFALERFCRAQTGAFRLQKVLGDFDQGAPSSSLSDEIKNELQDPFYYLGSGVQCYAFVSQDGTRVLKLFKHYHMAPRTSILKQIPLPYWLEGFRETLLEKRALRLKDIFDSHQIAWDNLREETALTHIQLAPSDAPTIQLIDAIGISHTLNLGQTPFVLQKRASLFYAALSQDILDKNEERAKKRIDSLFTLLRRMSQKNILSTDAVLEKNFGFIGDRAVEIDAGSFQLEEKQRIASNRKALYFQTQSLQEWIDTHSPSLSDYVNQQRLHETL